MFICNVIDANISKVREILFDCSLRKKAPKFSGQFRSLSWHFRGEATI